MREIKFRAWNDSRQDWEGSFSISDKGSFLRIGISQSTQGIHINQFTGLFDKNGKEIYEGDIVISKWRPKDKSEVKFGIYHSDHEEKQLQSVGFFMESYNPDGTIYFQCGIGTDIEGNQKYLEVIGNIYENPDLLLA